MLLNNVLEVLEAAESSDTSTVSEKTQIIDWPALWNAIIQWASTTGVKLILGLIALFILFKLTNKFGRSIKKKMQKKNCDKTITSVIYQVITIGLKVVWFILFLGLIGVETASIGSIIASISVAIGLAVQGSLANFAGGIMIVCTRPFKVGDFIQAQGYSGTVEDIRFFYTHIVTTDNKLVLIPNGILANGTIVNVNVKECRRVDEVFEVAYEADYKKAIQVIRDVILANDKVLTDKPIMVKMSEHGDSGIMITARCWTNTENYWDVHFYMLEEVWDALEAAGIDVPYSKLDVNLYNKTNDTIKQIENK